MVWGVQGLWVEVFGFGVDGLMALKFRVDDFCIFVLGLIVLGLNAVEVNITYPPPLIIVAFWSACLLLASILAPLLAPLLACFLTCFPFT